MFYLYIMKVGLSLIAVLFVLGVSAQNLPYFESHIGTSGYDDGVAYYQEGKVWVSSVSLDEQNRTTKQYYELIEGKTFKTLSNSVVNKQKEQVFLNEIEGKTHLMVSGINILELPTAHYHKIIETQRNVYVLGTRNQHPYLVCVTAETGIWEKEFLTEAESSFRSVVEDEVGNIYLAGYMATHINQTVNAWICTLNAQHEVSWSKVYGTAQGTDEFYHIECTPTGILASGLTYRKGNFDTYIVHTDKEGTNYAIGTVATQLLIPKKIKQELDIHRK